MGQKKRITKDVLRKYFSNRAKISGFAGNYRVQTPTGGEVIVTPRTMKIVIGDHDAYRAVVLIADECWGGGVARNGSREFMLAAVAHGEAWGVNIRPEYAPKVSIAARVAAFLVVLFVGCNMGSDGSTLICSLVIAVAAASAVGQGSKKEAAAKAEAMGFPYPRVHGSARFSNDEDLEKGGLL